MPRLITIDPNHADGRAKELLDQVQTALGATPNMMRAMAASPAVLDAYLSFNGALARGGLTAAAREQIALLTAAENECAYCAAAHTVLGGRAGVDDEDLEAGLRGEASDPATQAALTLARSILRQRGFIADEDLDAARTAGLDDGAIGEVVGNVALNVFTNYFNSVGQTELDFPAVALPTAA